MTTYALFIGVDKYTSPDLGPLASAEADANDLHAVFKHTLNYDKDKRAVLLRSPTKDLVIESLRGIRERLRPGDVFLLYFCGHGWEPRGSKEQLLALGSFDPDEVPDPLDAATVNGLPGCLPLSWLTRYTDSDERWRDVRRVFVLDACRVDPRRGEQSSARHRGAAITAFGNEEALNAIARNLTPGQSRKRQEITAPPPVIVKSCRENHRAWETAADDPRRGVQSTGIFCMAWTELLKAAAAERGPIKVGRAMLADLTRRMAAKSREARLPEVQEPWINEGAAEVLLYEPEFLPPPPPRPPPPPPLDEDGAWAIAQTADTVQAYERFLLEFPDGRHAGKARRRIEQLHDEAAWTRAQGADSIAAYERYLAEFPNGRYAERAQARIASLRKARGEADEVRKRWLKVGAAVAALVALVVVAREIWPGVRETYQTTQREQAERLAAQEQQRQERERLDKERAAAEERARQAEARAEQERQQREQVQKEQAAAEARVKAAEAAAKREQDARAAAAPAASPAPARAANASAVRPAPGTVLKDCGVCPPLVVLPRGRFTMGSPASEPERRPYEGPLRVVTIDYDLAVGRYEVTQREWTAVMGSNPSKFKGCDDCPVENVTWDDAQQYLAELNRRTGGRFGYRLLSEAEWEYMARGVTRADAPSLPFWWGTTSDSSLANHRGDIAYNNGPTGPSRRKTTPVGTFKANAFGVYDVHGNVSEFVQDVWSEDYKDAPSDGSAWMSGDPLFRKLRGGSWDEIPANSRSAYSVITTRNVGGSITGLRIARTLP